MRLYRTLLISLMIAGLGVGGTWPQASSGQSNILTVCLGPVPSHLRCDYRSIQAAVNASTSGYTIAVIWSDAIPPGLNFVSLEDITITKSLTLKGVGKGPVTQQGEVSIYGSFIIDAPGQEVTITGFTFLPDVRRSPNNIGIRVKSGSAQILNNYFHPVSHILNGVGIQVEKDGTAVITDNHFSDLSAIIALNGPGHVVVKGNIIVEGGVAIEGGRPAEVIGNRIIGTANSYGSSGIDVDVSGAIQQSVIIKNNSIVDTRQAIVIKGGKPVRIIDNLIANAAVAGETGIVIWPGFAQEVEMSRNVISGYTKYGIALLQNPCFAGQLSTFDGKISGSDNIMVFNQQGNLCPADYPWPLGFVKP